MVTQISIFLENKSGRLAAVARVLKANDIDIRALSIADTTDFGILRLIVDSPTRAAEILEEYGFTVSCTNVVAISVPDKAGGLASALDVLEDGAIDIEYIYAFVGKKAGEALVILRLNNQDKAIKLLKEKNIQVLGSEEVYKI